MNARRRIGIIATAAGLAVVTLGGGQTADAATATTDEPPDEQPIPDTDLGRALQQCLDPDDESVFYEFHDDGRSVFLNPGEELCMLQALGLPEWPGFTAFVGVLKFADWSVMRRSSSPDVIIGTGPLVIMSNEVAPDN